MKSFALSSTSHQARVGISWEVMEIDDIPAFLENKIALIKPKKSAKLKISQNRLEVELDVNLKSVPESERTWTSLYGTNGIWKARLLAKPLVRSLCKQAMDQLAEDTSNRSCLVTLARIVDLVHPSHTLQAQVSL